MLGSRLILILLKTEPDALKYVSLESNKGNPAARAYIGTSAAAERVCVHRLSG